MLIVFLLLLCRCFLLLPLLPRDPLNLTIVAVVVAAFTVADDFVEEGDEFGGPFSLLSEADTRLFPT